MKKTAKKNSESFIDKTLKFVDKVGNQKELGAIRDSFALMLPLIIAGAIGILGTTFFFGGWGSQSTSILGWIAKASGGIEVKSGGSWEFIGTWKDVSFNGTKVFSVLNSATFGFFSIYVSFILGYIYGKTRGSQAPLISGGISLSSFLICGGVNGNFHDANGLLSSILISLLSVWIFTSLEKAKRLKIKMPNGVPPAVGRAFSVLIPIIFTSLLFALLNYSSWAIGYYSSLSILNKDGSIMLAPKDMSFVGLFFKGVTSPFLTFVGDSSAGLGIMIIYLMFVGFFWWCGIHGSNLLNGIFYPIWMGLMTKNINAVANFGSYDAAKASGELSIAVWGFIEQFSMITGWGLTGMLVLSSILFSRNSAWKKVNTVAGPSAIFNINEPVTYGYPIMLNPILLLPTILAGPIAGLIAYLATDWGIIRIAYIYVPWPMPAPIGAVLTTGVDWRAIPVVFVILGITFGIYTPFVLIDNKLQKKQGAELLPSIKDKIAAKIVKRKNK